MAASSMLSDVGGHRDSSGGASRPPLPRPEGDNVRPVPLWEREFCHNAYDIPWETFCRNKWFIGLYKKVMDWDDSEALNNFLDSKERFRAKYHGEPYEEPVLDPDMYIDEVDHNSNVHQQGVNPFHTSSGSARMLSSGIWIGGTSVGGARNWNVGGGGGSSGGRTNWNGGSGSGGNNGSGRNRKSGGGGGSNKNGGGGRGRGRGINWNCFGPCNRGNQAEGQHQKRDSGSMQRNQNEVQQQQRSGIRQQQSQRGTKWRLVPPPKDDPFA